MPSLLATGFYFLAALAGLLTVAAVLASLYPGVTVVLAAILLHEHPDRRRSWAWSSEQLAVTLIVIGG